MRTHKLKIQEIPLKNIALLAGNPRRGNIDAVAESMETNGVYQPVIINKGTHTGREMEVIAGNHRVQAAEAAGLTYTQDAILLTQVGTAALRSPRQFKQTRVLARTHQEILVFVKGDRKKAAKRLGDVDVSIDLQEAVAEMERENDAAGEAAA